MWNPQNLQICSLRWNFDYGFWVSQEGTPCRMKFPFRPTLSHPDVHSFTGFLQFMHFLCVYVDRAATHCNSVYFLSFFVLFLAKDKQKNKTDWSVWFQSRFVPSIMHKMRCFEKFKYVVLSILLVEITQHLLVYERFYVGGNHWKCFFWWWWCLI